MFKLHSLCLLLIFGSIQLNGQGFEVKLSYNKAISILPDLNKQLKPILDIKQIDSLSFEKQQAILLFKTMPNSYQPKQSLPIFCEIEHQLSKLIKRRVKLGVP